MNYLRILVLFSFILFCNACGTVQEGFSNNKKNSNDEFLVEKKSPLVMPPDYDKLPVPSSENIKIENEESGVKSLISKKDMSNSSSEVNSSKNFEEFLLKKIKRN